MGTDIKVELSGSKHMYLLFRKVTKSEKVWALDWTWSKKLQPISQSAHVEDVEQKI